MEEAARKSLSEGLSVQHNEPRSVLSGQGEDECRRSRALRLQVITISPRTSKTTPEVLHDRKSIDNVNYRLPTGTPVADYKLLLSLCALQTVATCITYHGQMRAAKKLIKPLFCLLLPHRELMSHGNITFNPNGTVSTIPSHPLEWQEKLSAGRSEDDILYLPNIALLVS